MALPVDYRVCTDLILTVEHNGIVSDDDPFIKAEAEIHEPVAAQQLALGVRFERLAGINGGVREYIIPALDGVRERIEKRELIRECLAELEFILLKIMYLRGVVPKLVDHVPQQAAFAPVDVLHNAVRPAALCLDEYRRPLIAVAHDGIDILS